MGRQFHQEFEADPNNRNCQSFVDVFIFLILELPGVAIDGIELTNKISFREVVVDSDHFELELFLKELLRLFFKHIRIGEGDVTASFVHKDESDRVSDDVVVVKQVQRLECVTRYHFKPSILTFQSFKDVRNLDT